MMMGGKLRVEYLLVGGGGGGGYGDGGGGGYGADAGEYKTGFFELDYGSYAITIGAGGMGGDLANGRPGTVGNPSYIAALATANGAAAQPVGGGGDGAGGANTGDTGGPGLANSITGSSVTYAIGGDRGPGSGSTPGGSTAAGSGGTGGSGAGSNGLTGAAGIAVFRYPGAQRATGGAVTTVGSDTVHTFTSSGTFTL